MTDPGLDLERNQRFIGLLARTEHIVRRFARGLLPGGDGLDDVLQETALEAWKKFSDFESNELGGTANDFACWVCVIARYKVLSYQRDRSRDRIVFRDELLAELADLALGGLGSQEDELNAVEDCLEKMGEKSRRLLLSVHRCGDSVAKIAEETQKKPRQLYYQINLLRSALLDCVRMRMAED
ncbi:sigma-70 family RNA polymerase sigma factor [Aporhodopirellula aestuarii]|uniref:Sigma-70 family RNA polymerase sigma factor n=1 Tax=Aporhodopirellula aestuarii TaxID=2950107 RepID=A0ABT0U9B0_9BACT|nr:sigma-70 family RNA polymerase sigma factor [Aporhodopirellula aestuarii]MCM2373557.1 sigma-70 family RNA polymerase sigma factor [Aporhodopirellula aestuarii]